MGNAVKVAWKGTTTTYKLAVDDWVSKGGGFLTAWGAMKPVTSIAKMLPYVDIVFEMLDAVATEERFRQIEQQIAELRRQILALHQRLDEVNVKIALTNNKAKFKELDRTASELETIVQKSLEPDVTPRDLKNYCIDLIGLADRFLKSGPSPATGEELPFDLWRADAFETTRDDPPRVLPVHDCFTTWPALGLYAMVIATWLKLSERAQKKGVAPSREDARARARHAAALSTRPDFDRHHGINQSREYTLLEYAMLQITYGFVASKRGLNCVLTASVSDTMGHQFYTQDETDFQLDSGNSFCSTFDFNIGDDDTPAMLLSIEEMAGIGLMGRLAADLKDPFVGRLGPEWPKALGMTLYAVDDNDDLQQFTTKVSTDLAVPVDWERAPKRVGNGWGSMQAVVAGAWNGLYAVRPDGALAWYRHTGQPDKKREWIGPRLVAANHLDGLQPVVEHYMGSDDGGLYQHVCTFGGPGLEPGTFTEPTRQLWYQQRLADTNPPRLKKPVHLRLLPHIGSEYIGDPPWREYSSMFAGGRGTFYGIDTEGRLYWHLHNLSSRTVEGPYRIGEGWNKYTQAFAGPEGLLFSITHDGVMLAHAFASWEQLKAGVRRPTKLSEPTPVVGPAHWSSYKRFVPILESAPFGGFIK